MYNSLKNVNFVQAEFSLIYIDLLGLKNEEVSKYLCIFFIISDAFLFRKLLCFR